MPQIKQVLNTKIKEEVLECYWRSRASLRDQEITLQYFFYKKSSEHIEIILQLENVNICIRNDNVRIVFS